VGSVSSSGGRKRGELHFRETSPNSSILFFQKLLTKHVT
jgi:hypothetical protein